MLVSINLACTFLPIPLQICFSIVYLCLGFLSGLFKWAFWPKLCMHFISGMHATGPPPPHLRRHSLLKEMTSYIGSCVEDQGAKYRSIAAHNPGNFQNCASNKFLRGILELVCLHFMVGMLLILAACWFLSLHFVYYSYILIWIWNQVL
jgi:hypothetical protein